MMMTLSKRSCSVIPAPSLMLLAEATNTPTGSEFKVEKNSRKPISRHRCDASEQEEMRNKLHDNFLIITAIRL